MKSVYQVESPSPVIQFPLPQWEREQQQLERNVEARLRQLSDYVKDLCDEPYLKLLNEKGYAREAVEELAVKETTLSWIVRVAKHSHGAARERLWAHIAQALSDLERLAESLRELRPADAISMAAE
jgi:hypothetical protein